MNTSEVLNRAADLIEQRGWRQGGDGWRAAGGPLCLEGGIVAALGGGIHFSTDAFWTCPAYIAVSDYLGLDRSLTCGAGLPQEPVWRYNDNPERTAEEVVATLRAAAIIEAAKESADSPVVTFTRDEVTA